MNKQMKILVYVIATIVMAIIIYGLGITISHRGKIALRIIVAPSVAVVTLDNKEVQAGTIYVQPGAHTVRASLRNFQPGETKIKLSNNSSKTVDLMLVPTNEAGQAFLQANPVYQQERESIGGQEISARQAQKEAPIIALLPVSTLSGPYKIDYGESQTRPGRTVLLISNSSPNGRVKALKWLKEHGANPADLEIIFTDFISPLGSTSIEGIQ